MKCFYHLLEFTLKKIVNSFENWLVYFLASIKHRQQLLVRVWIGFFRDPTFVSIPQKIILSLVLPSVYVFFCKKQKFNRDILKVEWTCVLFNIHKKTKNFVENSEFRSNMRKCKIKKQNLHLYWLNWKAFECVLINLLISLFSLWNSEKSSYTSTFCIDPVQMKWILYVVRKRRENVK
jgi:hypothetical protein